MQGPLTPKRLLTPEEIQEIEATTGVKLNADGSQMGAEEERPISKDIGRRISGSATRLLGGVASGFGSMVPGYGPLIGGALGGATETMAQMMESDAPVNKSRVGLEAGISAVPLGRIFKPGGAKLANVLRGAAFSEVGNVGRRYDETGRLLPDSAGEAMWDAGNMLLGGAGGLLVPTGKAGQVTDDLADDLPDSGRALADAIIQKTKTIREPELVRRGGLRIKPNGPEGNIIKARERGRVGGPALETPHPSQHIEDAAPISAGVELEQNLLANKRGRVGAVEENLDSGRLISNPDKILDVLDEEIQRSAKIAGVQRKAHQATRAAEEKLLTAERNADIQDLRSRKGATDIGKIEVGAAKAQNKAADDLQKVAKSQQGAQDMLQKERVGVAKAHESANNLRSKEAQATAKAQETAATDLQKVAASQEDAGKLLAKEASAANAAQTEVNAERAIANAKVDNDLVPQPPVVTDTSASVSTRTGKSKVTQTWTQKVAEEGDDAAGKAPKTPPQQYPKPDKPTPLTVEEASLHMWNSREEALEAIARVGQRGVAQRIGKGKWRVVFEDGEATPTPKAPDADPIAAPTTPAAKVPEVPQAKAVVPEPEFKTWIQAKGYANKNGGTVVKTKDGKFKVKGGNEPPPDGGAPPAPVAPKPKAPKGGPSAAKGAAPKVPVTTPKSETPVPVAQQKPTGKQPKPRDLTAQDTTNMSNKDVISYYKSRSPHDDAAFYSENMRAKHPDLADKAADVQKRFASGVLKDKDAKGELDRIRQEWRQRELIKDLPETSLMKDRTEPVRGTPKNLGGGGPVEDLSAKNTTVKVDEAPKSINQLVKEEADLQVKYGQLKDAVRDGKASTEELRAAGKELGEKRAAMAKAIAEAEAAGKPVPSYAKPALKEKKPVKPKGKGPTSDQIIALPPDKQTEELKKVVDDFKKKGKGKLNQKGEISAEILSSMGLGAAGAFAGAAANPSDPITGAFLGLVGGASTGYFAPSLLRAAQHNINSNTNLSPAARRKSELQLVEKMRDTFKNFSMQMLPEAYRASLLTSFPGLPINAYVGPWGSATMYAMENALMGDERGVKAFKELMSLKFFREHRSSWDEAKRAIASAHERTEGVIGKEGPLWFRKSAAIPAQIMTAGDIAARKILQGAGFTEAEARIATLTSEPISRMGKGIANLRKTRGYDGKPSVLVNMLLPFYRTNVNQLEQGIMRMPIVGIFARKHWTGMPTPLKQAVVQGVISGSGTLAGFGFGYMIGDNLTPWENRQLLKFINNFGGAYGGTFAMGVVAGQGAAAGKDPAITAMDMAIQKDMPLPNPQLLNDMKDLYKKISTGEQLKASDIPMGLPSPPLISDVKQMFVGPTKGEPGFQRQRMTSGQKRLERQERKIKEQEKKLNRRLNPE
jgi:hypothetical protein